MYSFQKVTQFSQGYNVQDAPASNTDGFLSRDTCAFFQLDKYPCLEKMSLSSP
jgi:hypothetical protein